MKPINTELEKHRIRRGSLASDASYGNNGAFLVRCPTTRRQLKVIISDGLDWEHVSVSVSNKPNRIPSWGEMCFVKDLFWLPEECVVQYHPSKSSYVNVHPGTLHLWRSMNEVVPMPPLYLV